MTVHRTEKADAEMSSNLFEGDFQARAVTPEVGAKKGKPVVRVDMEIVSDGPHQRKRVPYEGKLDEKNIKYTKRHMITLGWQGKDIRTFVDDVKRANRVVPVQVRIASWDPGDGRQPMQWNTIDRIGSFAPPLEELDRSKLEDVNTWFAEAGDVGGSSTGSNDEDLPF